jgi:hypothetical protein
MTPLELCSEKLNQRTGGRVSAAPSTWVLSPWWRLGEQQLLSLILPLPSPAPCPCCPASSLPLWAFPPPSGASAGLSRALTSFSPDQLTVCITKPAKRTSVLSCKHLWLLDNAASTAQGQVRRPVCPQKGHRHIHRFFGAERWPEGFRKTKTQPLLTCL